MINSSRRPRNPKYVHNNSASKYIKQTLIELKGEIEISTLLFWNLTVAGQKSVRIMKTHNVVK